MQVRAGCRERARRKVSERFVTNGPSSKLLSRSAVRQDVSGELYGRRISGDAVGIFFGGAEVVVSMLPAGTAVVYA
jgi:hypothetical protein